MRKILIGTVIAIVAAFGIRMTHVPSVGVTARASDEDKLACPVTHGGLKAALITADAADTTGLNNHYCAVVVNRDGVTCAVAYSGPTRDSQWLLSRQIAAAKAFTANGLSLDSAPLSTAQL